MSMIMTNLVDLAIHGVAWRTWRVERHRSSFYRHPHSSSSTSFSAVIDLVHALMIDDDDRRSDGYRSINGVNIMNMAGDVG